MEVVLVVLFLAAVGTVAWKFAKSVIKTILFSIVGLVVAVIVVLGLAVKDEARVQQGSDKPPVTIQWGTDN